MTHKHEKTCIFNNSIFQLPLLSPFLSTLPLPLPLPLSDLAGQSVTSSEAHCVSAVINKSP